MKIFRGMLLIFLFLIYFTSASDKVQVGGNFLTVFNTIYERGEPDNQNKRTQFDVAGNVNLTWNISENITGAIQLQSSAGEGSLGFATN